MSELFVIFTGANRNEPLFRTTVDMLRSVLRNQGFAASFLWCSDERDDPSSASLAGELGVRFVNVPRASHDSTWMIQANQFRAGSTESGAEPNAMVLKTRPDVVLNAAYINNLVGNIADGDERISVPFVHPTYPGLVADHFFAGRASVLMGMTRPYTGPWHAVMGPKYYEAHVRRYWWLWSGSGTAQSDLLTNYEHSDPRIARIQSGDLGARAFKQLHRARLEDYDLRDVLAAGLLEYWAALRRNFALPSGDEKVLPPYIDRFGPRHEDYVRDASRSGMQHPWGLVDRDSILDQLVDTEPRDALPTATYGALAASVDLVGAGARTLTMAKSRGRRLAEYVTDRSRFRNTVRPRVAKAR